MAKCYVIKFDIWPNDTLYFHCPLYFQLLINHTVVKWEQCVRFSTNIQLKTCNIAAWQFPSIWASHPERENGRHVNMVITSGQSQAGYFPLFIEFMIKLYQPSPGCGFIFSIQTWQWYLFLDFHPARRRINIYRKMSNYFFKLPFPPT